MKKLTIGEAIVFGIIVLLVVKYVVVGLKSWNETFHPTRIEDKNSMFMYPLLGIFQ